MSVHVSPEELSAYVTGATLVAGLGVDYLAARRAVRNEAPELAIYEDLAEYAATDEQYKETTGQRFGRFATRAALPLVLAGTAGVNTLAYASDIVPADDYKPSVGVVVDYSGAAQIGNGDASPADRQLQFVTKLDDSNRFKATVVVAKSGEISPIAPSKLADVKPFGSADLSAATKLAFKVSSDEAGGQIDAEGSPTSAVVVLTDGNTLGSVDDITRQSTTTLGSATISRPVFVVNVADETSDKNTEQLKQTAEQTGGKYWDIKDASNEDISKVLSQIDGKLADSEIAKDNDNDTTILKYLGGVLLLGSAALIYGRSQIPVGRGPNFTRRKKEQ